MPGTYVDIYSRINLVNARKIEGFPASADGSFALCSCKCGPQYLVTRGQAGTSKGMFLCVLRAFDFITRLVLIAMPKDVISWKCFFNLDFADGRYPAEKDPCQTQSSSVNSKTHSAR